MQKLGLVIAIGLATVFLAASCEKTPPETASMPPSPETPVASPPESGVAEAPTAQEPRDAVTLEVPGRGTLHVPVPENMQAAPAKTTVPGGVSLRLEGPESEPHVITLTVLGVPGMFPHFGSNAWLSEELEQWKQGLPNAEAAGEAVPVVFNLDAVHGVYVVLDDPATEEGQYSHVLQGFFNVDGCIVSLQALHNEARASAANRLLAFLVDADWAPQAVPADAPPA